MTFKISDSNSRSMGTKINVGSENGSKLGKDTGVNIDSKFETKSPHKIEDPSHIHIQVQSH